MSDTTPAPLNDDERARLEALEAAQAAQALPDPGAGLEVDAGASLAQMSTDAAEPLPHEAEMDRLMAEFKAMSERVNSMETELGKARTGYAAAVAKLGPPEVAIYAKAIYDKLASFKAAHPDAPPGHFDAIIAKAAPLGEAAQGVIDGGGHVDDITGQLAAVVDAVDRFVSKTHPRKWGKPIDFSALAGDLEDATDAADRVAQIAG